LCVVATCLASPHTDPAPQEGDQESSCTLSASDKRGQPTMLHIRPSTYVASLLVFIPSVIITLRLLEDRKQKKSEERDQSQTNRDRRATDRMNGHAGTCTSPSPLLIPHIHVVEAYSNNAVSTRKRGHRLLRRSDVLMPVHRRRPAPARSPLRSPAKLPCPGMSRQLTADLT
jgi:hypothetical protein